MIEYTISDVQLKWLNNLLDEVYEVAEITGNDNITSKIKAFDEDVLKKLKPIHCRV